MQAVNNIYAIMHMPFNHQMIGILVLGILFISITINSIYKKKGYAKVCLLNKRLSFVVTAW